MNSKTFIALRYMFGTGWMGAIVLAIAFAPPVADILIGIILFFAGMILAVVNERRRTDFITVISGISILGIKVGVAALIAVLSVFNGFNGLVKDLLVGFDPHLRVIPAHGAVLNADSVMAIIRQNPEVVATAPYVSGRSAAIHKQGLRVVQIRGMPPEDMNTAIGLGDRLTIGRIPRPNASTPHPVVLGSLLSYAMGASLGDTVSLLSQSGLEESMTQLSAPTIIPTRVTGIFETANKEYDSYYAYTDLATARLLLDVPKGAMGIDVRIVDLERAPQVRRALLTSLSGYRIETWQDLHRDLFAVMELERWAAFVILSLIIVVAVFNVLGSLTMTVIKKRRDIGILKTMGASDRWVRGLFVRAGLLIGVVGTLSGLVWGVLAVVIQKVFSVFTLNSSVYIIPALPVELHWFDLVVICLTALVLATGAAIYPARRAAALLPAQAVRWE